MFARDRRTRIDDHVRRLPARKPIDRVACPQLANRRGPGADGLFVPKVVHATAIKAIASDTQRPLNVLACPGLPSAQELPALGVRRLSAGSAIAHATWNRTAALTREFLVDGQIQQTEGGPALSYAEINALLELQR